MARELLTISSTRFHVTSLFCEKCFTKIPGNTLMTKQRNSLMFHYLGPFLAYHVLPFSSKCTINYLQKPCLALFITCFNHFPIFDSLTLSLNIFLPSDPHVVKRAGSWTTSLGLYIKPVMIGLNILPANFQLTVMSSSCTTSLNFFLSQINRLPTNFHMTMNSSSHYPVSETKSEDNSPPKLYRAIILFLSLYLS